MSNINLQNEELDRIGQSMLDATRLKSAEIEQIVSSPKLFSAVKTKIEAEQRRQKSKNLFNVRKIFEFQPRQLTAAAAVLLVLLIGGAIGLSRFVKINQPTQLEQVSTGEIQSPIGLENFSAAAMSAISDELPKATKIKFSLVAPAKINRTKAAIVKSFKTPTQAARRQQPKQKFNPVVKDFGGEFYAVGFTGSVNETGEEMRVVRTELSRSSLFALGVNLSLENETEKIKTDLLVGADGVARAIRFVN